MKLKVNTFTVKEVCFGPADSFVQGRLTINKEGLIRQLLKDGNIKSASLDIALPGQRKRIAHILDVIKPIADVEKGNCFPGLLGNTSTAGDGEINQLEGLDLMTCGYFNTEDEILRTREAIVDMWGENRKYSPFSQGAHLVLTLVPQDDAEVRAADQAVRLAGLLAARHIAALTLGQEPEESEIFAYQPPVEGLPKVVLVLQLASIGVLFDTLIYGRTVDGMLPTLIHPNELMAGAVVSDEYFYGGQRQPTIHYQQNPLVKELYARHGRDLNFAGIIVTRGYYNTDIDKRRAAGHVARLAEMLGADGAILHPESGGNSHVDAMLGTQALERLGIKTVLIAAEMGDEKSSDVSLIDFVPEATAIISAGNRELLVEIEEADEVIGGGKIIDTDTPAGAAQKVPLNHYFCANSQLGAWTISMDAI